MAPKKKEEVKERPILGRFRSNLKMGIVGMPNVGKSTLFNTLSRMGIPAENFPFCTIDPNNARVNVPDERFNWLCDLYKPKSSVPAFLEIVDIAGLVRGAANGEGLGNAFLSHISAVDGIFHVTRAFDDPDVIHVEDRIDPVADLEIIHSELRAKDKERLTGVIEALNKLRGAVQKAQKEEKDVAEKVMAWLDEGNDVRFGEWTLREIECLNTWQLLSAKPVVYLVNMSVKDYARKKNKHLPKIFEWVQAHGGEPIIPFSGAFENDWFDLADEAAQKAYAAEHGAVSALPKIITTGFKAIHLIYFFTAGADEVKCWQIRRQTKAPQAAGTIHTDFEKGFICAEVMKFDELKELGNEHAVKAAGKYRQEGKNYEVLDGDIMYFKAGRVN
ncbi:MAG: P-loop containing nucleoside triphosphate hydrolase protein [Monoraphidium minutum]|nr:MAG: P-loop containing nucleoside triphosphate hydrolase protein [Monoraphidium minutum]